MSYLYEGRYALANPENGITALSINGDVNLFGRRTLINTTVRERYPDIQDEPKKKCLTNKQQWWVNLAIGAAVTVAFAACAVICVATGGAALVAFAAAGAALGSCAVTVGAAVSDAKSGQTRSGWEFAGELALGAGVGAMAGACIFGAWEVLPAAAQAIGVQSASAFGVSQFTACTVPKIATAAGYAMLASNGFITANQTYELGSGQNLMLEYLFNNNQTAYDNYVMLSELLLQAEMELGSENSGLAESQTQKINRKREEAQTEKTALNSAAVTNAESVEVEEAAASETSQTAESSLEKSVNVGVVSAQEEEALGKEAKIQSQSVSKNEAAKQNQSSSENEGVFFNQSSETSKPSKYEITWNKSINATQEMIEGTNIPKSFTLDGVNVNGNEVWVHSNATKHMGEFVNSAKGSIITENELMISFQDSVKQILPKVKSGRNFFQNVNGWEIGINGDTGVIYHALYK
jgi:hypothetical protein